MDSTNHREALNTGRQFEIDLLKAFCIILMIVCHVFDGLTTAGMGDDLLKHTIYFLGNTSAGLFIFSMGIGIVYTKHDSPAAFAKRGIKLFLQGHLLSFILNASMELLSSGFSLSVLLKQEDFYTVFSTEILAFAGLTFLLTALLKKLKCRLWVFCAVALAFQCIATFFHGVLDDRSLAVRYILGVFLYPGSIVISIYPLCSFFIYAVFGMVFGELLKRAADKRTFYLKAALCGAAVCAAICVVSGFAGFPLKKYILTTEYHAHILPAAIFFLSQTPIWAALAWLPFPVVKGKTRKAIEYLSHNITNIYVIQWFSLSPLSFAILIVTGDFLPPLAGLPLSAAVCLITIVLSRLWNKIKTKVKKKKERTNVAAAG